MKSTKYRSTVGQNMNLCTRAHSKFKGRSSYRRTEKHKKMWE